MIEDNVAFCRKIEIMIIDGSSDSYIDAVLELCEEMKMEPFMAARLLSDPIKEKIKKEGQEINLLPGESQLPF